jgi:probable HAF family extracellular repeat protein
MQDLGTLPGAFATIAGCCHTINNEGEVVGFSIDGSGSTAFVWKDKVITDLNALIPSDSILHLLNSEALNDLPGICLLSDGWARKSRSAARVKFDVSATATMYLRSRNSRESDMALVLHWLPARFPVIERALLSQDGLGWRLWFAVGKLG